jgi:PAS domain S-box-containing protein
MRYNFLRQMRSPVARYGFAIAMAVISVAWRYALTPLIGPGYQYVTVFPLIIVVAMLAGRGAAIVHAAAAGAIATYYFTTDPDIPAVLILALVIATGFLAGDLAQRLHNAANQAQRRSEELTERENLIRSITQNTEVQIGALDKDFRFIFFNEAYQRGWHQMWQQQIEIGDSLLELTNPWPREQRKGKALWERAFKGESFRVTVEFGDSAREKRLFDIHFNPIHDAAGNPLGAAQIMRDITEQVQTEAAASRTELFYRQTLESIPGMVFTTRPDGYCDYQSRQWVEYTGVAMKDMLGDGWNKLLHPDDRKPAMKAWQAAVDGLASYDVEYRVRRYDGLYEWFKVRGHPIRDASGTIVRWFGVAANINDLKNTEKALRDSEARFRGTFENAATGITQVDLDGNWLDVNQTFCRMVGYTKEALIGTSFLILTLPEDMREDMRRYDALKRGVLDSYTVEKRYRHKDGHILWVELYRALQRDETGKPLYSIAVVVDITERKRAEEALLAERARLHAVLESLPVAVWIADRNGTVVQVNKAVQDIWGKAPLPYGVEKYGDYVGWWADTAKRVEPRDWALARAVLQGEVSKGEVINIQRFDGRTGTILNNASPVVDADGQIIGGVAVAQDITVYRQAQEALRESEERLRQFIEYAPAALAMFDRQMRYLSVSRRWKDDYGLGDIDLIGRSHYDIFQEISPEWKAIHRRALAGEIIRCEADRFVRADGSIQWLKWEIRPWRGADGRLGGIVIFAEDITSLKQTEEALRESERKFRDVFEQSALGMGRVRFDDARWVDVNDAFCRMLGYSREEMLSTSWPDITHPDDVDLDLVPFRKMGEGMLDRYSVEKRFIHKQGYYVWTRLTLSLVRDSEGRADYEIAVIEDITNRRRAEEALRQSEERFRKAFEIETVGILFFDMQASFLNANDAFLRMIGYDRQALERGELNSELVTLPEHMPRTWQAFEELQKTGRLSPYEKELIRPDGSHWWGFFAGTRLSENEAMEFVIDVTDRKRVEEALRQSEEQFHSMFDRHNAVKLVIDPETGEICDANQAAAAFYGYSRQQLCGMRIQEINQLTDDEIAAERRRAVNEERKYFVFPHRLADGTVRIVEVYSTPVPIGGKARLYSIIHDITERKKAEEALRQSERQFRELADSMPQIVFAARPDGVVDYFNRKWEEVTTGDLSKIGDAGWIPALHPDDVEKVRKTWYECVRTGDVFNMEFRLKVPDSNQTRWYIVRVLPIRDEQGAIVRWFGTATDIHDLKQIQESLKASERRYRTLFESIDEGFCIIEMIFDAQEKPVDYRFLEVNPAFERHTGLHAAAGETIRNLAPEIETHWYEIYGQVAATGQSRRFVNESKALNRWFDVYAFRVGAPHEHKVALLFTDITRFKQTQQDLLQYKDRLESKNREMESIIGIVSHDLRAPLVNIQGFSHEIEADCKTLDTMLERVPVEDSVEQRLDQLLHHAIPESLQYVQTSAEAMNRLVMTLVETARAGTAPNKPERIDMDALMAEIIDNLKIKFDAAEVSYDVEPLPECFADRTQVTQIFTNLLDNAVKYLHPDRRGAICLKGAPQADGVLYSVCDNGIGISQAEQEKIFEPYYQLKEKAAGGIGMGLATVKKLVERNNGKIWVISEKGRYSIFYVALPAAPHVR